GRIMQRGEQHVLFQSAGIRFDALQDARMKGMEKIAVAQQEANHFGASLENSAGLRVGAEPQAPDGLQYPCACFPAHLRAGIQHAGNRSYANGGGLGNLANRRFPWNCFHNSKAFAALEPCSVRRGIVDPFDRRKFSTPKRRWYPQPGWRIRATGKKQENG